MRGVVFHVTITLFILFAGRGFCAGDAAQNTCILCHSDYWGEVRLSVHGRQGITCDRCHGGDPSQEDAQLAMDPAAGFIGTPSKRQTAQTCGECHADIEAMNFYGIRTDQLARYKTSVHGKRLFQQDNQDVAICTDCHGYHDISPIADPASPVYPLNIPQTCNRCHGNATLMGKYNHPVDIFEKYTASVHGQALLEKKDFGAANCASCHGSHGAVPPGVKDIDAVCGKCHINEKKYFEQSPHFPAVAAGLFSECISCHGNHDIKRPGIAMYQESCLKCHRPGDSAMMLGKRISEMMSASAEKLDAADAAVRQAAIDGIFVDLETAALQEAKTHAIEMVPVQHTLALPKVAELYDKVTAAATQVQASVVKKRQGLQWRKAALVPLWLFVIVMAGALWAKYKYLNNRKDGRE